MSDARHRLEVSNLSYSRAGALLCSDLSFHAGAGEMKVIRGANGSGKSTLLQILAGLYRADSGSVCYEGKPHDSHASYPDCVCYLGHRHGMRKELSVESNLAFWATCYGTNELLSAAMHYFDLIPLAQKPMDQLSAGWVQRTSLTRLILSPAKLWLLDEPTSNLDAQGSSLLQSLIVTRLERGGTVILASHAQIQGIQQDVIHLSAAEREEAGDVH